MSALMARARISLRPIDRGGLKATLGTGTRSLLLTFPSGSEDAPLVTIGAVIEPVGPESLDPGSSGVEVVLTFWTDEAEVFVHAGGSFQLCYGGRVVGDGAITEVDRDRS